MLKSAVTQLRALVSGDDDEALTRLYPPAYAHDEQAEAEYRSLMHDDMLSHRLTAIDTVLSTLEAESLDAEQTGAWMGVVNDIRLVLGTRLDISESLDLDRLPDDDPNIASYALYAYLSWLLEQFVEAVSK